MNAPQTQPKRDEGPGEWLRWANWLIVALVVLALYLVFRFRLFGSDSPEGHPLVGRQLVELELQPLTGSSGPVTADDLEGRVSLVVFWQPHDPASLKALPAIAHIEKQFHDRPGFRLLPIAYRSAAAAANPDRLRDEAQAALERQGVDFPTYTDPNEATRGFFSFMNETATGRKEFFVYPTMLVVDRNRLIRGVWRGSRPGMDREIEDLLRRLLGPAEDSGK